MLTFIRPYYEDSHTTLYHGDCREILPLISQQCTVAVVDPPYDETSSDWDSWQSDWIDALTAALPRNTSLWCFGTARMFLDHATEFSAWRFAQEALWVKRNGSGPTNSTRLVKIHEWAYHWYRGPWSSLHHQWDRVAYTGPDKSTRRLSTSAAHQNVHQQTTYIDDSTRQPQSVTFVIEEPSVRYRKRHRAEKPEPVVATLVKECCPPDGVVLDCFAGSGTTGVVAKQLGLRSVLIEADTAACAVAAERLADQKVQVSA